MFRDRNFKVGDLVIFDGQEIVYKIVGAKVFSNAWVICRNDDIRDENLISTVEDRLVKYTKEYMEYLKVGQYEDAKKPGKEPSWQWKMFISSYGIKF